VGITESGPGEGGKERVLDAVGLCLMWGDVGCGEMLDAVCVCACVCGRCCGEMLDVWGDAGCVGRCWVLDAVDAG
jgi:hypothetical protein